MKIDPDNYDLRELRRIADERRSDRGGTDDRRGYDEEPRGREDDRSRRRDEDRRAYDDERGYDDGRDRGGRDGRGGRDRRDGNERRDGDGYDRRDRRDPPRREDGLRNPRDAYDDHASAHDEVLRADRIASHYGLGGPSRSNGDDRRDGDGHGNGYDELGYDRGRDGRMYDFEEVGKFRFDKPVRDRPRGRAGEALRHNQLEQLLIHETAAPGGSLEKPYLSNVPKEYAAERVVFDWLEFLVLKGGYKRTMDALRYYLSVDWITEDVETQLHDYLIGFSGSVSNTTEFDVDDHHLSLLYVAQLSSMENGAETGAPVPSQLR